MAALSLLALGARPATGQAEVDWRRYYPLAVGNVWEYEDAEAPVFLRYELLSDTVADGHRYFRRRIDRGTITGGAGGWDTVLWDDEDYVRYDSAGYVVSTSPRADTVHVDPCSPDGFSRPLDAPHGAEIACPDAGPPYRDSLQVFVGTWNDDPMRPSQLLRPVHPDSLPPYRAYLAGAIHSYFELDVGPLSTGNLWGPRLRYARIGGVERGTSWFATPSEPGIVDGDPLAVTVLGNPTRGALVFRTASTLRQPARYRVLDGLGRTVEVGEGVAGQRVAVRARLAPGLYTVEVTTPTARATAHATVVR